MFFINKNLTKFIQQCIIKNQQNKNKTSTNGEKGAILNIIIIEDDDSIREILERSLKHITPEPKIVPFNNADQAWEFIIHSKIKFDLIISDVNMPGKMNGLDILGKIKKDFPEIIFISISGNGDNLVKAKFIGANHVLQKPFTPATIITLVKECFNS